MRKPPKAHGFHLSALTVCLAVGLSGASCARIAAQRCDIGPAAAAGRNAATLYTLAWAPFGRSEAGWAIYEPLISGEIGGRCPAGTPGFAAAFARWQASQRLPADGVMNVDAFTRMRRIWQDRRPFVAASRAACPSPPAEASLAVALPSESYGGKRILLRPRALAAYRAMVAAARAQVRALAAQPKLLTIFSAYRSPQYDDARCAREGNCHGVVRAACSAHRTALAVDLYLGEAPGHALDSSDDVNRLSITRGAAYRWLVANAGRFGFVNYAFEPWHWEWVGERP
jgi:hypothetical protein